MSHDLRALLLVALAGAVLPACQRAASEEPPPTAAAAAAPPLRLLGLGRVEAGRGLLALAAELDGTIAAVPVALGDTVQAGAVVVQLADEVERRTLASATVGVDASTAALATAEAALSRARATAAQVARGAARQRALYADGGTSAEAAEQAELALVQAVLDTAAASAGVRGRAADLEAARRGAELAAARVRQRQVRAPEAGVVLRVVSLPGEGVVAGATVLELAPLGPRVVRCELDERVADGAVPGQAGVVRAIGTDRVLARGRVTAVAPGLTAKSLVTGVVAEPEDRRVREVRLTLDAADALPYNARVECVLDAVPGAAR